METVTTNNVSLLAGELPVRTHANRFFGTIKVDGQHPRVAALVCYSGDLLLISLVGYDTSCSAALANLWLREDMPFLVGDQVKWDGPRSLKRSSETYKQFSTNLEGTKEMHYIGIITSAHLAEGILHPPDLPTPPKEKVISAKETSVTAASPIVVPKVKHTRFVLGNWNEDTPNQRSFLGHLHGMRVLFLHKDEQHPHWSRVWASELWQRGLVRKLVQPVREALGIKAWALSGDLDTWGRLIGDGSREGWLPWQVTEETEMNENTLIR